MTTNGGENMGETRETEKREPVAPWRPARGTLNTSHCGSCGNLGGKGAFVSGDEWLPTDRPDRVRCAACAPAAGVFGLPTSASNGPKVGETWQWGGRRIVIDATENGWTRYHSTDGGSGSTNDNLLAKGAYRISPAPAAPKERALAKGWSRLSEPGAGPRLGRRRDDGQWACTRIAGCRELALFRGDVSGDDGLGAREAHAAEMGVFADADIADGPTKPAYCTCGGATCGCGRPKRPVSSARPLTFDEANPRPVIDGFSAGCDDVNPVTCEPGYLAWDRAQLGRAPGIDSERVKRPVGKVRPEYLEEVDRDFVGLLDADVRR